MARPFCSFVLFECSKRPTLAHQQAQPTTAWPLSLVMACLVIYASLYPFSEWRNQGIVPLHFLIEPLPQYWTGFDVGINLLGYIPLGFFLALAALRSQRVSWAVSVAVVSAGLLSLTMETLQNYLPSRVASNVDLLLNTAGAWLGACCAFALERIGAIDRWSDLRARWFSPDARGALLLLLLWPPALLFPAAVPMGLGQVLGRIETTLAKLKSDTSFLDWLPPISYGGITQSPLMPTTELLCVALGLLIPCLLGYGVIRSHWRRAAFSGMMIAIGIATSSLSAALSYGPEHAWIWLDMPVQLGVGFGIFLALLLLVISRNTIPTLTLLALSTHLTLLNQAPLDPYFAQTLRVWEQGRFIHFYGLIQWLGWLWPYAVLLYMGLRLVKREARLVAEK